MRQRLQKNKHNALLHSIHMTKSNCYNTFKDILKYLHVAFQYMQFLLSMKEKHNSANPTNKNKRSTRLYSIDQK